MRDAVCLWLNTGDALPVVVRCHGFGPDTTTRFICLVYRDTRYLPVGSVALVHGRGTAVAATAATAAFCRSLLHHTAHLAFNH